MRAYVRNDYTGCHFQIWIVTLNAQKIGDREKSGGVFVKNVKYVACYIFYILQLILNKNLNFVAFSPSFFIN